MNDSFSLAVLKNMKNKKNVVQIIIPTWNALAFTKMTLASLFKYTTDHPYHLTIVDNNSRPETVEYLKSIQAQLEARMPEGMVDYNFIFNSVNQGYSVGNITGWKSLPAVEAKYGCLCNNDLVFSPSWLSKMVDIMERDPQIGILGAMRPAPFVKHPMTMCPTGEAQMRQMLIGQDLLNRCPERELQMFTNGMPWDEFAKQIEAANYYQPLVLQTPPAFVMTCCALLDKQLVDSIGGVFRENWGSTYGAEDIDLSWRIAEAGRKVVMAPVYVHHHVHAAVDNGKLDMEQKLREGDKYLYQLWKRQIHRQLLEEVTKNQNFRNEEFITDPKWFIYRILENFLGEEHFWQATKEQRFELGAQMYSRKQELK